MFKYKILLLMGSYLWFFNSSWLNIAPTQLFSMSIYLYFLLFLFKKSFFILVVTIYCRHQFDCFVIYKYSFFSLALLNKLSFFHPLCLFLFFFLTLYGWKYKYLFFNSSKIKRKRFLFTTIIFMAFCLGSYWSAQELLWGGFWNWDFVELTLLLLVLLVLFFKHIFFKKRKILINIIYNKYFVYITLLYFFINRTGLVVSQHSFSASPLFKLPSFYIIFFYTIFSAIYTNYLHKYFFKKKFFPLHIVIGFFLYLFCIFGFYTFFYKNNPVLNKYFFQFYIYFVSIYYVIIIVKYWYFFIINIYILIYLYLLFKVFHMFKKWRLDIQHVFFSIIFCFLVIFFLHTPVDISLGVEEKNWFFKKSKFIYCTDNYEKLSTLFFKSIVKQTILFSFFLTPKFMVFTNTLINFNVSTIYCLSFGYWTFFILACSSKLVVLLKTKL